MKVTIVHTNNKKQLLVSTKTMEKLMERFARDDSKLTITHFRESVPYLSNNYEGYKDMPKWMHIYPAAEFAKDENNNLKMKAFNGILLLKFGNITDVDGVEAMSKSSPIANDPERMDIYHALALLSENERTCITLQIIEGEPIDRIVEITGMAQGTVKSHLFRGKQKLSTFLRQNGYEK